MKLDTLGVQAFIAISDGGSFQRAAEILHLSQTGVTRRLQNLEQHLGLKLIERTTRSVELTGIGRDFLPQARRLLQELSATLTEMVETGKSRRGDVCIACVPTAGVQFLPRIIAEYTNLLPDNRITIIDDASSGVAAAVLRREAEFGIGVAEAHHPDLLATSLLKDHFVLICRDDHALAQRKSLRWKELEPHRLIYAGAESANRFLLDQVLEPMRLKLQPFYLVQRSSTALGLVAEGIAAAVVPSFAIQKGTYPRVRVIPLGVPRVSRDLVLLRRKTAHLSPAALALYDLIESRAKARSA
jgi:DNA-binding transcriptional LysR family regulator